MDNSLRGEQRSGTPPQSGISTGLQFLDAILNWLTGLMRLTEEEQKDAGIYLGHQTYK
jgi:hypothetical protein